MIGELIHDPEFWKHASIPFVAGLIGWITNWVAIKLTFYPLEFVGIRRPFGWQGIIPAKAGKMARIFVDRTMFRLGTLREVFQSMDPEMIAGSTPEAARLLRKAEKEAAGLLMLNDPNGVYADSLIGSD